MILKCLFIIRKSHMADCNPNCPMPELLVAWDEYTIDENGEGWLEECEEQLKACKTDVEVSRVIEVEVDVPHVRRLLLPPTEVVQGKVGDPPHPNFGDFRELAECPRCSEMDFNGRRCHSCGHVSSRPGPCPND